MVVTAALIAVPAFLGYRVAAPLEVLAEAALLLVEWWRLSGYERRWRR
jgi:hypothetical protein